MSTKTDLLRLVAESGIYFEDYDNIIGFNLSKIPTYKGWQYICIPKVFNKQVESYPKYIDYEKACEIIEDYILEQKFKTQLLEGDK